MLVPKTVYHIPRNFLRSFWKLSSHRIDEIVTARYEASGSFNDFANSNAGASPWLVKISMAILFMLSNAKLRGPSWAAIGFMGFALTAYTTDKKPDYEKDGPTEICDDMWR